MDGVPDITATLTANAAFVLHALKVHPCAQLEDAPAGKKLLFSPPSDPFLLCEYRVRGVAPPPIRGFYQMKARGRPSRAAMRRRTTKRRAGKCTAGVGFRAYQELDASTVKILVQLKVSDGIANAFEYCQVAIPLPNRYGSGLVGHDYAPGTGG